MAKQTAIGDFQIIDLSETGNRQTYIAAGVDVSETGGQPRSFGIIIVSPVELVVFLWLVWKWFSWGS